MNQSFKTFIMALIACALFLLHFGVNAGRVKRSTVNWNGQNWAFGCDWWNNDLANANIPGEQCGGRCAATPGCTHFTWTTYQSGTCWMKSGSVSPNDAYNTWDNSMVCGYVQPSTSSGGDCWETDTCQLDSWQVKGCAQYGRVEKSRRACNGGYYYTCCTSTSTSNSGGGSAVGQVYSGVLTTRHPATEAGACQLPETSYVSGIHPVALGNIDSLGNLKFQSGLCGHILRLDCGHGPVDIIVSNANLGGGLDLYASSWDLATGNKPPGQEYCSVQLTDRNALSGSNAPVCYYSPESEKYNDYYHLLGLFNTGSRIVSRGSLDGRQGQFNSLTSYIAFNGGPISQDASVVFYFTDGSSLSLGLRDCIREDRLHIWS